MRRSTIEAAALLVALSAGPLGGVAVARSLQAALEQESELTDREVRARMDQVLRERDRLRQPDGRPAMAVGVEQEGNDLRSQTPMLLNTDGSATLYDEDESYVRARALFEEDAQYHRPPTPMADPDALAPRARGTRVTTATEPAESEPGPWTWVLGGALGAATALFLLLRRGPR